MESVNVEGPQVEKLGAERYYGGSLKQLKVVNEATVTTMKDWDPSTEQLAPFVVLGCKCSKMDFNTGRPTQAFIGILSELASRGLIVSLYVEPSYTEIQMVPTPEVGPLDGYSLFCLVHMTAAMLMQHKREYPFLLNENEELPLWTQQRRPR